MTKYMGGGGSDDLYGDSGNDVLASGDLRGEQNDNLYGGNGADLFILGEVDNSSSANFNWSSFATNAFLSSADNFVAFSPGASIAANSLSLFTDIAMSAIGATQQGVNPAESTKAVIHDFNPIEDVVVIPLQPTGRTNVGIDAPANGNSTIQFRYEENNSTDYFAELNLQYDIYANAPGKTSTKLRNEDYKQSLLENALIISEDGIRQGWEPNVNYTPSGNLITESDLNIDLSILEGQRFLVLGAYAGQQFEGDANSNTLHGTKYGDRIYGYDVDQESNFQSFKDGDDNLHGYGGDDKIWGGSGNDYLFGGSGDDLLFGGSGNNNLFGGQGRDTLIGGDDNDILHGGSNYDFLTGGGGIDKFYLSTDGGARITDFENGVDKLMVSQGSGFSDQKNWFTWNNNAVYDHEQFYIVQGITVNDLFNAGNVQTF